MSLLKALIEKSDQKTTNKIHYKCSGRESLSEFSADPAGQPIPGQSPDQAGQADNQGFLHRVSRLALRSLSPNCAHIMGETPAVARLCYHPAMPGAISHAPSSQLISGFAAPPFHPPLWLRNSHLQTLIASRKPRRWSF